MIRKALLIIALSVFSTAGFAGVSSLFTECDHPFVDLGYGLTYLENPEVDIATIGSGSTPLAKIDDNGWTHHFNMGLGYAFFNPGFNWLTKLFGHENSIELKTDLYHHNSAENKDNLGTGQLWYIDGSGSVFDTTENLNNVALTFQHRYANFGLYFQGHNYTIYPHLTLNPYTGIVYTYLRERYRFSLDYNPGAGTETDRENYKLLSNYYGVSVGDRLNYHFTQQFLTFADVEAQLLRVNTHLKAVQVLSAPPINEITVWEYYSNLTYRAILTVGATYKFTDKVDSMSVSLEGGLDNWGYNPHIDVPTHTGDSAIHVEGTNQTDGFVGLQLHVPID